MLPQSIVVAFELGAMIQFDWLLHVGNGGPINRPVIVLREKCSFDINEHCSLGLVALSFEDELVLTWSLTLYKFYIQIIPYSAV